MRVVFIALNLEFFFEMVDSVVHHLSANLHPRISCKIGTSNRKIHYTFCNFFLVLLVRLLIVLRSFFSFLHTVFVTSFIDLHEKICKLFFGLANSLLGDLQNDLRKSFFFPFTVLLIVSWSFFIAHVHVWIFIIKLLLFIEKTSALSISGGFFLHCFKFLGKKILSLVQASLISVAKLLASTVDVEVQARHCLSM